jgi:hypothetical protein
MRRGNGGIIGPRRVPTALSGGGFWSVQENQIFQGAAVWPYVVPGQPTIGTATYTTGTSATVSYTAPASNGGSAITSYTAVSSPGGFTGILSQAGSGTITVNGLTSNTNYTFTVYATNGAGNSTSSGSSNQITVPIISDTYFPYVPLLLNTTSTNTQTNSTFLDSSANNFSITRVGTTTQGSVTPYWPNGRWSNYFSSSSALYNASVSSMNFGSANAFTIEAWLNWPAASSGNETYFEFTGTQRMILGRSTTGFRAYWNGTEKGAAYTFATNTWYHIAVVRNSTTVSFYINGALLTSFTETQNWSSVTRVNIGINSDLAEPMTGYVSNLRVVNGTAVYTGVFTTPTTPLTAITNTQLLTCQSNGFKDNSTNNYTLTAGGTTRTQAFQPFSPVAAYTPAAYGGSMYFNGSSDYIYVTTPGTTAFNFGTGNFTIEFWINVITNGGIFKAIWSNRGSDASSIFLGYTSSAQLVYFRGGQLITDATALQLNSWNHVALVRSGTVITMYKNGVSVGSVTDTTNLTGTNSYIGQENTIGSTYLNAYISNFRVVNGTAVYTGAFTPPTSPVTAIANTSLLLNFTNAGIYDAAVQNNQITTGSAQVSSTTAKWGTTSMKFNGSTDYLRIPSNTPLNLGTGSFTVEAWVYLSAMTGDYFVISAAGNGGAFFGFNNGTAIGYGRTAVAWDYSIASGMSAGAWYHVAWCRSGTSMRIFVNGSQVGTTQTTSQAYDLTTTFTSVGAQNATYFLNGYIQDLRVTNAIARYTANFTAPTSALLTQ